MTERKKLNIAIVCYPTFGGSGVIATEIGIALARRGHKVHFISSSLPSRLNLFHENVYFHEVETMEYPLFNHSLYTIGLASKMVEVITYENIDIVHVHYAVPHATSAYLARQVNGGKVPKIITTLHGTDITLVGNDRSYLPITRFSIVASDGVTAPSQFLKFATYDKLNVSTTVPIEVIPNFVDTERFQPAEKGMKEELRRFICHHSDRGSDACLSEGEKVLVHVSNFRPVKRIPDIIRVFSRVAKELPARLVLVGDGPERSNAEALARELGVSKLVCFLGKLGDFLSVLQGGDVFLLPSEHESFGLAALEAMSCGLPVIGSTVEGLPEVVLNGRTGYLSACGDVEDMAKNAVHLLSDSSLWRSFSEQARQTAVEKYSLDGRVDQYEDYYYRTLDT